MKPRLRNVMLISLAVLIWAGALLSVLSYQRNSIVNSEKWVKHSYDVVNVGKDMEADISRLIAKQRGFIITGEQSFLNEYEAGKRDIGIGLSEIASLTKDSTTQKNYINKLQRNFSDLTNMLDAHLDKVKATPPASDAVEQNDASQVRDLNLQLQQTMSNLLETETDFLAERITIEEQNKATYAYMLYGGIILSILLIFGLNLAVFRMNYRRENAEKDTREMQDRYALAMKSTSDGVYDWNIVTNEIYFSTRYKEMIGYTDEEFENAVETNDKLIHPEDYDRVWQYVKEYLAGEVDEYSQMYRIKHKEGHWVWVSSRGRAIFDESGKPIRLVGAHTDVTHIKKVEESLKNEKEAAESANRAKSEFLANMSHEIRTPLNSIIGVSNILAKSKKLDEEQRNKLISTLQNSSISLMDLINDVLDFAKIESGELKIEERNFELEPLMEQIISIMAVKAQEKGINFRIDYDALEYTHHHGDEQRVRQILLNLIGNAIKFTEKGSVTIKAHHEGNSLMVDVTDTGIGISKKVQDKLFKKFAQGDSSVNRKYGGSGLGLVISRQLAEMMGGTITLKSTEGEGSVFSLCLPVNGDVSACTVKKTKKKKAAEPYSGKILIAEDYEGNIVVIKFLLESMGVEYDIASNGEEAIEMYKAGNYPLVMMDVQMPKVDGFEATRGIRKFEQEDGREPCVIIAMTAHALAGDSDRCIAAGMNDYLSKPLMEADLKEKFGKHLFKTA